MDTAFYSVNNIYYVSNIYSVNGWTAFGVTSPVSYGAIMSVYEGESCVAFYPSSPSTILTSGTGQTYALLNEDFTINDIPIIVITNPSMSNLLTLTDFNS